MRKKRVVAELRLSDQVDKMAQYLSLRGAGLKEQNKGERIQWEVIFFPPVMKERSFVWKED